MSVMGCLAFCLVVSAQIVVINSAVREISFSGMTWQVKNMFWGPGPNHFSSENVHVDNNGHLHLKVQESSKNNWTAAEVFREEGLNYGTYTWIVKSDVSDLDPNLVLGLFTWDTKAPEFAYREIDFEVAKWGEVGRKDNSQFVIQPYNKPGHLLRFQQNATGQSKWEFSWSRDKVVFSVSNGSKVLAHWEYSGNDIPPSGGGGPRINLWMFNNKPPTSGKTVEVVIEKFSYLPQKNSTNGASMVLDSVSGRFGLTFLLNMLTVAATLRFPGLL